MRNRTDTRKASSKKTISSLIKDYFLNSDEKLTAWLLLIGAALCVISFVGLMTALTWWTTGFWALLAAKAGLTPFLYSLGQFSLIAGGVVAVGTVKDYFINKLSNNWSAWLRKKIILELFGEERNFLDLKRNAHIDNIDQRIQEDTKNFTSSILNIGANVLNAVLSLGAFTATLWVVGGALSISLLGLNIIIPGYLVWVSLLLSIVATGITHLIGKSLPEKTKKKEKAEADLRSDLALLNREAEKIALGQAEKYHKRSLNQKIKNAKNAANERINTQTKLNAFKNFYYQAATVLPHVFAAPLYFSGAIALGQLMQVASCFGLVNGALNMFVDSYEEIASCRASIERIVELQKALEKDELSSANRKTIQRSKGRENFIAINNLTIKPPQRAKRSSSNDIIRGLQLKLQPGEHVLIQGDSGIGKSTLFKVIAGTWLYGNGNVSIPGKANNKMYFLPQHPILPCNPCNTLKAVLAYPDPTNTYTKKQYLDALQAVGGMDKFRTRLDENRDWTDLSGGEQQRISLARALLKKPKWLFLDEATSALDEPSEHYVYKMLQRKLKDTTIVSIGHRSTIKKYHSKVVFFNAGKNNQATMSPNLLTQSP